MFLRIWFCPWSSIPVDTFVQNKVFIVFSSPSNLIPVAESVMLMRCSSLFREVTIKWTQGQDGLRLLLNIMPVKWFFRPEIDNVDPSKYRLCNWAWLLVTWIWSFFDDDDFKVKFDTVVLSARMMRAVGELYFVLWTDLIIVESTPLPRNVKPGERRKLFQILYSPGSSWIIRKLSAGEEFFNRERSSLPDFIIRIVWGDRGDGFK